MGAHSRNHLCSFCGKPEGAPIGGDREDAHQTLTLLVDLDSTEHRVWCSGCAGDMLRAGDPITNFREFGFPENSADGPYAIFLARYGRGIYGRGN